MTVLGQIKKGAYFDSITLMRVGQAVAALPGVDDAALVMGTHANRSILTNSGMLFPGVEGAGDTDLVIAVRAQDSAVAEKALKTVDEQLKASTGKAGGEEDVRPRNLEGALTVLPDANLVLISVAGRYAAAEARKALEKGLHVMLFSDNVSLEQEIELKRFARDKGLLVMGPDCGTAIINGVPLAFANVVRRGSIGIVAAAGTGLQEVSALISNAGAGVSQAIGTGGRDIKKEVGGIMFIEGIKALVADDETKVILLVSKPPHPDVQAEIFKTLKTTNKPVVSMLLGAGDADKDPATLEEAALMAVALSRGEEAVQVIRAREEREAESRAKAARMKIRPGGRYIRGLFSGGTFCSEAQIILSSMVKGLHSNVPTAGAAKLADSLVSVEHTVVDLGEDEFTQGRPHPMIDYSLRNKRIAAEAVNPETAVILLDVVIGYGSHPDPAAELTPIIRDAGKKTAIVCSVTGTDADPQQRGRVVEALRGAGAVVMPSNAAACRVAGFIARRAGGVS